MNRHFIVLAFTGALAVLALVFRNFALLGFAVAAHLAIIGVCVAFPQLRFFVPFVCRGQTAGKQVAITFDDGPDPRSTPQLLGLLREQKTPAAFFVIGAAVEANPELSAQIAREGHLIENHSYKHSHATNCYPPARLRKDLERTQAAVEKATGRAPRYFRPPNGLSNDWMHAALKHAGLRPVAWSIRSLDTQISSPEKIVARIVRRLHPGAIILLHDGGIPAGKLTATVRLLLDELRRRGYEVVRLDTLIGARRTTQTEPQPFAHIGSIQVRSD